MSLCSPPRSSSPHTALCDFHCLQPGSALEISVVFFTPLPHNVLVSFNLPFPVIFVLSVALGTVSLPFYLLSFNMFLYGMCSAMRWGKFLQVQWVAIGLSIRLQQLFCGVARLPEGCVWFPGTLALQTRLSSLFRAKQQQKRDIWEKQFKISTQMMKNKREKTAMTYFNMFCSSLYSSPSLIVMEVRK